MSDVLERTFSVGARVRIEASTTAGDLVVSPGPGGEVTVRVEGGADAYAVERVGDVVLVRPQRSGFFSRASGCNVFLEVPESADLSLVCTSGDIIVNATVHDLEATSASGDIRIEGIARRGSVRTASGDVFVGDVGERLEVTTASGTVRCGTIGRDLSATSGSGDVYVDGIGESAEAKTASGDIQIHRFDGVELVAKTFSGGIRIGVPPRRLLEVDLQTLSGELHNRLPESQGGEPERSVSLRCSTVSGDLTLRGA